jgi:AAA15 family ATPase/GTPase
MLIEFTVGNYRSFKQPVTFSMVAAKLRARDKTLDADNVFHVDDDLSLLKSATIYGANASGKSNFVSAMWLMQALVRDREWWRNDIAVEPFRLSRKEAHRPSFFEVVFLLDGTKYRYGLEATNEEIVSEWLFHVPSTKEARLFVRDRGKFTVSDRFKEGKGLEGKTRKEALFLTVVASFNGEISRKISQWFLRMAVVRGLDDPGIRDYTVKLLKLGQLKLDIIQLLGKLDLGISDIELGAEKPMSRTAGDLEDFGKLFVKKPEIRTVHQIPGARGRSPSKTSFELDAQESEGTRKLFRLAGPMLVSLNLGSVLAIDELDSRLHPMATKAIVAMFNSNESNCRNAQLIFTTHDTNLLNNKIFRRDQVWFAEKNAGGATEMYSLAEFKVRNDASFEKDYIQGRYGAIPFIGDVRHLTGNKNA